MQHNACITLLLPCRGVTYKNLLLYKLPEVHNKKSQFQALFNGSSSPHFDHAPSTRLTRSAGRISVAMSHPSCPNADRACATASSCVSDSLVQRASLNWTSSQPKRGAVRASRAARDHRERTICCWLHVRGVCAGCQNGEIRTSCTMQKPQLSAGVRKHDNINHRTSKHK